MVIIGLIAYREFPYHMHKDPDEAGVTSQGIIASSLVMAIGISSFSPILYGSVLHQLSIYSVSGQAARFFISAVYMP